MYLNDIPAELRGLFHPGCLRTICWEDFTRPHIFCSPTCVFSSSSSNEIKILIRGGIAPNAGWVFWPKFRAFIFTSLQVQFHPSPCSRPHWPTCPPVVHVHDSMYIQAMNWNSFSCCLAVFPDCVRGVGMSRHTQLPTFSQSVMSAAKTFLPTRKQIQLCEYVCVLIWMCSLMSLVAAVVTVTNYCSLNAEHVWSSCLHIRFIT